MTDIAIQPRLDRHSFIVRVWHEGDADQSDGQWRGSIEHVPSGQRLHFTSLDTVTEFVSRYLVRPQST